MTHNTVCVKCVCLCLFKIGDSAVLVHQDGNNTTKEEEFQGSEWLWELLRRKRVNKPTVREFIYVIITNEYRTLGGKSARRSH